MKRTLSQNYDEPAPIRVKSMTQMNNDVIVQGSKHYQTQIKQNNNDANTIKSSNLNNMINQH